MLKLKPILWPPDAKNWLIGKDSNAGKDWRQEEKGQQKMRLWILVAQLFKDSTLCGLVIITAGVQPRLIQGIRRKDGIGEGQETTA